MVEFEKLERDGKVAVLVSPGFGAGWSSGVGDEYKDFALFDRRLVELVEADHVHKIEPLFDELFGEEHHVYFGGLSDVKVEWVPKGERFYLHEYDGNEWIVRENELKIA
jgi:hypothetical protein